jgi:hypothetical protein
LEIFDEFDIAYLQACKYYENPGENSDIRQVFLLLIGDINTGKTTLVVKYMNYSELMAKQDGKYSENDIIYIETPIRVTFKRMFASLLERLTSNKSGRYEKDIHTDRLIDLIIKELRRRRVKILFIDEVQILVKASRDDKEDIFNGFKKLANQSQTRLILVGTPSATELFRDTRWVDERFRVLTLPSWNVDKEYIDLLFSIYLAYREYLPDWDLVDKNGMVNEKIARELHDKSGGRLGKLIQTIRTAAVHALTRNKTNITPEDYEAAKTITYSVKDGKIIENQVSNHETPDD